MNYKIGYSEKALKQLKKLDNFSKKIIIAYIEKNLVNTTDPRLHGKALVGNRNGEWRYRVGNYRILAEIKDDEILILVLEVVYKDIYK